jgi:hypothetical protein
VQRDVTHHRRRLVALDGHEDDRVARQVEVAERRRCPDRDDVLALGRDEAQSVVPDRVEVRAARHHLDVDAAEVQPGRDHAADRAGSVHDEAHGHQPRSGLSSGPMVEGTRPVEDGDEWATLTEMLDFLRATAVMKVEELTDEQASAKPVPPSDLTPAGVVKHLSCGHLDLLREVTDGRTGQ